MLLIRLAAGDDLVDGIEAAARAGGVRDGIVRGGPGSLSRGSVEAGGPPIDVPGPAAEILTLVGEVHDGVATVHGAVGDPDGRVYAGRFVRGQNPVCITVELMLEQLNPS